MTTVYPIEPLSPNKTNTSLETRETFTLTADSPLPMATDQERTNSVASNDDAALKSDETHSSPVFPTIPTRFSTLAVWFYGISSATLSTFFLVFYVLGGALIKSIPTIAWDVWSWCQFKDPDRFRPFYQEEKARKHLDTGKLVCDIGYYARQVGLECAEMKTETEDGFILTIQHIVDRRPGATPATHKYPVLLLHGLLQASGTFCVNDESSLAFYLCKSGYDVWMGNNRGYFKPEHKTLKPSDPKFWAWNLQEMASLDLPAMVSFVCAKTNHEKIALVAHSQGAGLSFLALSKGQVPQLGKSLSCLVALTPAIYAGDLLRSFSFSFVRIMSERIYRTVFGVHAFVPFMLVMHGYTPGPVYGWLGYQVFNFLFSWSDLNWERRLRNRLFQFSPVYVSTETMRWWLGKDSFVKQKCWLPDTPVRWYDPLLMPPISLYVGGRDRLVDGGKLIERFAQVEDVQVIRSQLDEDYEHLDCLWAMDCIERIGEKVREDIWFTTTAETVVVPRGCFETDRGKLVDGQEQYIQGDGSLIEM